MTERDRVAFETKWKTRCKNALKKFVFARDKKRRKKKKRKEKKKNKKKRRKRKNYVEMFL